MIRMLLCLKLSQRLYMLPSFVWILFIFCCSDWLFFVPLYSKSIWFLPSSTLLLIPYKFFLTDWIFFMLLRFSLNSLSSLITVVLNSASSRLSLFFLSPFCLVLFLEFCSVLSLGPCFFFSSFWQPPCVCFYVLGTAALTPCLSSMASCRKAHL